MSFSLVPKKTRRSRQVLRNNCWFRSVQQFDKYKLGGGDMTLDWVNLWQDSKWRWSAVRLTMQDDGKSPVHRPLRFAQQYTGTSSSAYHMAAHRKSRSIFAASPVRLIIRIGLRLPVIRARWRSVLSPSSTAAAPSAARVDLVEL